MIRRAIDDSQFFLTLLSSGALSKRGYVQRELKMALDMLEDIPPEDVFLIPVRLDECQPADERLKYIHRADIFPSYEAGLEKILHALGTEMPEPDKLKDTPAPRIITNALSMKFAYIPPGTFMMGSPEDEPGRFDRKVTLTQGFYMQTTQVTQGQWKALMGDNPSHFENCGDNGPVENISWEDSMAFIEKLSQAENAEGYRLPTEAEWEYACRSGSTTALYTGPIEIIGTNNLNVARK